MRDESSASNAAVPAIPSQQRIIQQILSHWQPFQDLKLMVAGSRRAEQLSLRSQQRIVATVEDSVLRTEMAGLESHEEDAPKRLLFFKPMSWLGQIRPHRRVEAWSASLWQTFFVMTMGVQIRHCGDVELPAYLANAAGPVPLLLHETAADKTRKYRADYNNNPPVAVAFMPAIASTSGRLHSEFV